MEFYIHNKDDQKLSTLVNLGTVFKFDETNYIVYYNKQVEKSMIDIYIGKISYGDQSLVISKIDESKQSKFLQIIKEILSNKNPETEISDYAKIIDTATIILDGVQKIQIPTISLENLKNYHNIEKEIYGNDLEQNTKEEINNIVLDSNEVRSNLTNNEHINMTDNELSMDEMVPETRKDNYDKENNKNLNVLDENNKSIVKSENSYINSNSNISNLDNLLNERESKKNEKTKKSINTPLLILLVITIIIAIVLYIWGQNV